MKALFLFIFILLCSLQLTAQGEANNWYFGEFAGITFNTNPPSSLSDGQLSTLEGCSSISDTSGNLLFYTDGRTVWDKEHNIMPNADYFGGTGLMGDPSSTSSGLIVPHPSEPNLYYIFTVDEPHQDNANAYPNQGPADQFGNPLPYYDEGPDYAIPQEDDGFNNGFNYSLVDMNLRNGLGNIVEDQQNIHLVTYDEDDPEEIKYKCAEKITAVVNDNCNSIWVITHFVNRFYAFSIDENGVDPNPVVTEIGPTIPLDSYRRGALGYLKASPEGNKLLTANLQDKYSSLNTGNVYLYDFNNATGEVENPILLKENILAYGVEFSPNSKVAYATSSADLVQWNLEVEDIQSTEYTIENVTGMGVAIQLAPDGKIYFPQQQTQMLNVINFPNNLGENMGLSTSIENGAIYLEGNSAMVGLPPFIQSIFTSRIGIIEETEDTQIETQIRLCEDETFILSYEHETPATYQWYENGELLDGENSSSLEIPFNTDFTENLNYTLDVFPENGDCKLSGIANIDLNALPKLQNTTISECINNINDFSSEFNLTENEANMINDGTSVQDYNFSYFFSEEEAENNENPIPNENNLTATTDQVIYARVENIESACYSITEIELQISDYQTGASLSLIRCDDELNGIQDFDLTEIDASFLNQISGFYTSINNALTQTNQIANLESFPNTQTYVDEVFYRIDNDNCGTIGKVELIVQNLPMLSNTLNYMYCLNNYPETIRIQPSIPENEDDLYEYFWPNTNQTTYSININEVGTYQVLVTEIETGCEAIQEIEVTATNLATFSLITQDATRFDNYIQVIIDDNSLGDYEFALDSPHGPYQDSPLFENLTPGFYTVFVRDKNGCGVVKREVALLGIMQFFTPNNDGINDYWKIIRLDKNIIADIYIFDRFGKLLFQFDEANQGWDGNYHGKPMLNNDYWYAIHLDDGRILRGNFTLKR
ncbi:T9SS type B sorting domain-containing protein [Psychroflexus planctonicus]|uniref:T9SS type B sorting domain-containing protein n=1 Tax=Psychroflexus planctonicus TaxID=1526575 RepID=UPI001669234E|nr:T9SS type B sorting domain-containing protein [Psychroflexus planctonicus]